MDPLSLFLLLGFALAFGFALFASYGNFCTMGAVSDWINMGELGRVRSWSLAAGVAIVGVALANAQGSLDISLASTTDSAPVPYLNPELRWLRNLFGGFLFGVGMTLAGGCSSKNLLRFGGGDLKSLLSLIALGAAAWSAVYTETGGQILVWLGEVSFDLATLGSERQSAGAVVASLLDLDVDNTELYLALAIGGLFIVVALASAKFRAERPLWLAGVGIGVVLFLCWLLSAGSLGIEAFEESEFSETPVRSMGAQSLSFTLPIGQAGYYLLKAGPASWLTLGVVMTFGLIIGSVFYAFLTRTFKVQWFQSVGDFFNHLAGGLLMGFGGVISMGCTVGQGLSGVSTLAIGSFLTLLAIVTGCALTLRFRLYRIVYEDASFMSVALTALAESRFLPARFRRLEKV